MPRAAKSSLSPRNGGKESIWHRIACNRNKHGLTQVELAATPRIVRTFGTIIRLHRNAEEPSASPARSTSDASSGYSQTPSKPSRKCCAGWGKGRNLRPPGKRRS